jgi:hypothetical protein
MILVDIGKKLAKLSDGSDASGSLHSSVSNYKGTKINWFFLNLYMCHPTHL